MVCRKSESDRSEFYIRNRASVGDDRGWRSNSAGERGRSSKEDFPEEVAPQQVDYAIMRAMSKGWRDIKAKGRMHVEPGTRSWHTFGAWTWLSGGVGGG